MQAQTIKKRFFAVNRERLRRTQLGLRQRQRDFIELLPLLFHINDPLLPGYVSADTACGVSDYRPSKATIKSAEKLDKKFKISKRALRSYEIYALYLTGSSGTIAYSDLSDFDIWICHKPGLQQKQLAELKDKANRISEWASTLDLEVHFFIINEESFRNYDHGVISEESSGSAQHHLLLEEFYRSGLLVAGRYPAWWLVPVEEEHNYDDYLQKLVKDRAVPDFEYIDFGNIAQIPAEEFFGASLWQIFKGIDSPYKAVLKILLLEAYAEEYPKPDLLCQRYKRAVHENNIKLNDIDPYIMICNKVEEHLLQLQEPKRLELARRCFYFKTGIRLSENKKTSATDNWRREKLSEMVDIWGWDHADLLMLDSRSSWKIHRVLDERRVLIDELMHSYQLLSGFARKYSSLALIDQRDMTVLGRKLYATFERKSGKIDIINHDISPNLLESKLSVHQTRTADNRENWLLFRGHINQEDAIRTTPLKRSGNLLSLLAWCHFNKLVNKGSAITLHTNDSSMENREIRDILSALQDSYPENCLQTGKMTDLERPSKLLHTSLFINTGIDPMRLSNLNRTIVSNRNNALSYSGFLENLVLTIEQVSISSWNEVFVHKYQGINGILDCLSQYIESALKSPGFMPAAVQAFSFSSTLDQTVSNRIEQLFNNSARSFCSPRASKAMRYVVGVEDKYYVLQRKDETVIHKRCVNMQELLNELATAQEEFVHVILDEQTLTETPLQTIYRKNKPGIVQLFYLRDKTYVDVYIIDEHGSLFKHRQQFYNIQVLLGHFDTFLYSTHNRQTFSYESAETASFDTSIEYYEIFHEHNKTYSLKPAQFSPAQVRRSYFEVTVIIENWGDSSEPNYRIFCQDEEFSSLQYGNDIFDAVARNILQQRSGSDNYPIYITDIDIAGELPTEYSTDLNPSILFLQYKVRIETYLNNACERLRESNNSHFA